MAHPPDEERIAVRIDGRDRALWYNWNAIARLEDGLGGGVSHMELLSKIERSFALSSAERDADGKIRDPQKLGAELVERGLVFSVREVRAMLWGGLLHESPELTLEEAGELLDKAEPDELSANAADYVFGRAAIAFLLFLTSGDPARRAAIAELGVEVERRTKATSEAELEGRSQPAMSSGR